MKVFLVDDHPTVRRGLCGILENEADLEVCGEAEDVGTALEEIERTEPDVVLVDISLKGRSGLELVKILNCTDPALPILMVSNQDENLYAGISLQAGALGYVMKTEAAGAIISAVREVVAGHMWVSPRMDSAPKVSAMGNLDASMVRPETRLSDRELEVFALLGQGLSLKEVSDRLCANQRTIAAYLDHINEKLGLGSFAALLSCAAQWLERRGEH